MKNLRVKSTFFLLGLFLSIQTITGQVLTSKSLVGEWYQLNSSKAYHIFYGNGAYKDVFDGIELWEGWGKIRYEVYVENDTTWLNTIFKKVRVNGKIEKNVKWRRVFWLNGDYITWANYKGLPGIKNHIDEYAILVRTKDNPIKTEIKRPKINYVFPEGFKGAAWIAFNQPNGVPPTYDSLENPILKIPLNGLLLTTLHEDVFATANEHYTIWEESNNGKTKKRYKSYDKFARIDSTCCTPDQYYAFMGGFNQTSREDINENIFKKSIQGNVMSIYIGKYKWFEKNFLHPWDSIMD